MKLTTNRIYELIRAEEGASKASKGKEAERHKDIVRTLEELLVYRRAFEDMNNRVSELYRTEA